MYHTTLASNIEHAEQLAAHINACSSSAIDTSGGVDLGGARLVSVL
jgi:hypothetical protein